MRRILATAAAATLLGCLTGIAVAGDAEAGKQVIVRFSLGPGGEPAILSESAFTAWTPEAGPGVALRWAEAVRDLAKACGNAPLAPPEPVPANDGKFPIRLGLRWNPTILKCKFYIGQVLCNYDDEGLRRASAKIELVVTNGPASDLIVDAGNDVPCRWIVSSAQMIKGRIPGKAMLPAPASFPDDADFTSALESAPAVEPKDGRLPDATLRCLLHPAAPYGALVRLLSASARFGVRHVLIGSAPETLYPFTLSTGGDPADGARRAGTVRKGLEWLKNHQNADGRWSSAGFEAQCAADKGKCGGAGSGSDWETTGLSLMAFLGAGHTHARGEFKDTVRVALQFLKDSQNADGSFGAKGGTEEDLPAHAVCVLALAEAYALGGKNEMIAGIAQKAADFLSAAQTPGAGWGVKKGVPCDTVATGWAVFALQSAKLSRLNVSPASFDAACKWFDAMTDAETWQVALAKAGDKGADPGLPEADPLTATAAATIARIFCMGRPALNTPEVLGGGILLKNSLPKGDALGKGVDVEYLYFGTQTMFQLGSDYWKAWSEPIKNAVALTQRSDACASGSWDPVGARAAKKGHAYATALNTLTLEMYSRALAEKK